MRQKSRHTHALLLALGISFAPISAFELAASPELPRFYVDTTYVPPSGRTISVLAGGDFQAALDTALPGDVITLQAGATFTGPFTMNETTGAGWIVVQSSAAGSLPSPGTRVNASHASLMPKIVSPNDGPALLTAPRAHHFRFIGIEFTVAANVTRNYGLVQLGNASSSQSTLADVPHHLIFDRVYVHGNATVDLRRGFGFNSAWTAVIDSTVSGVHEVGADSQAIGGWNGPGPFKIVNCYLEGAGENVLFGGADPSIPDLVPSDIEIRGNHFYKPLSWRIGDPSYAGKPWSVKNLFELKNARRVLVDGNVFENNWLHAQSGFAILFTVRNQDGTAPWSVVEDVTFTRNIVRHTGAAVNILGQDNNFSSQQTKRILIKDNCFEDVSGATWGGTGRLFQILDGTAETVIDHNTALHTGDVIAAADAPHTGFVYRNNLTAHNQYGVGGDGAYGNPLLALSTYFPGALFQKNLLMGGDVLDYPTVNYFPATWAGVGFVDFALADYRLSAASPYKLLGTDGKDLGADIAAVSAATAGAIGGGGGTPPADTTPPSVSITSPAAGAAVSGTVSISASAADNVGVASVEFKVDGVALSTDSTAPYAASWDSRQVANGQHTLTAIARDGAGNTASASVAVNVANAVAQSPYPGQPFPVPGVMQAEDFDLGGEGVAYHDLVAGNQGGLYRTNEGVDIIVPYLGGYAVNGFQTNEWLEYTIAVSQSGIYRLEALASSVFTASGFRMEIDGANVTGPVSVPNTGSWTIFQWVGKGGVSLAAGSHVLRLYSEAEYFNVDAARITPDNDTTLPSVSITSPTAGAVVSGTVSIAASASDNVGVASVEFKVDGVALSTDSTAPYAVSWDSRQATNGQHTLTALARDSAGNTASASVTVNVSNVASDTTPPSVSLISPAAGAVLSGMVSTSASASDNVGVASVEFKVDGVAFGTDTTAPYSTSWNCQQATNGQHTLTALARDGAGNSSSASVAVNVANGAVQSPYRGQPFPVPGVIPAEDFDLGGEGVAYHDLVAGNQGGLYRTAESVDIIAPYAGGYVVNGFQTGEWLEYTIAVPESGFYRLAALASSMSATSRFRMEIDGMNVTGSVSVPNTGGWKLFQWVSKGGVSLAAGQHVLRLYSEAQYFNVDAVRITREILAWKAKVNVTAAGGELRKSAGCNGCQDAGAISSLTISSGDLFVELTASETNTQRAVGLSYGNTNAKVADIDFAVQFWPGGGIDVRENGVYRAETTYSSGDVFRIAVEASVVKFYKNGALFYTSAKAPVYPMRVDSSLLSFGATLKNVWLKKGR